MFFNKWDFYWWLLLSIRAPPLSVKIVLLKLLDVLLPHQPVAVVEAVFNGGLNGVDMTFLCDVCWLFEATYNDSSETVSESEDYS